MVEEINKKEEQKGNITEKLRSNPWILSTFVLGILVVVLLISSFGFFSLTGNAISADKAGQLLLNLYNSNGVTGLSVDSVKEVSGLYEVNFLYNDKDVPVYITKDGKYAGSLNPLTNDESSGSETKTEDIPKSDKPNVELFIWGYCPYGVQAQGPLAEVAKILGKYANFKAVLYYDGHGEFETQQNKIQECIQKNYPEKYWAYAAKFVSDIYPVCSSKKTVDCDKTESVKLMNSLGIDSNKILNCVASEGASLLSTSSALAKQKGVSGSPTLIINGVKANVARDAESFKSAVCASFKNVPEECGTTLSSNEATASGNC